MTPDDENQQLRAKLQTERNEIGRLTHIITAMKADKKAMHSDLVAQRDAMDQAIEAIASKDTRAAQAILRGALSYREQQREPRKAVAA